MPKVVTLLLLNCHLLALFQRFLTFGNRCEKRCTCEEDKLLVVDCENQNTRNTRCDDAATILPPLGDGVLFHSFQ